MIFFKKHKKLVIFLGIVLLLYGLIKIKAIKASGILTEEARGWKQCGIQRAREYVYNKYGKEATVKSAKLLTVTRRLHIFPKARGDVAVKMEMDGCRFTVLINGNENRNYSRETDGPQEYPDSYGFRDGADNFQDSYINTEFINFLEKELDVHVDYLNLLYGNFHFSNGRYNGMSSIYCNGTNITEALNSTEIGQGDYSFIASTADSDLLHVELDGLCDRLGTEFFCIADYRTQALMEKNRDQYIISSIENYAQDLKDCIIKEYSSVYYYNFTPHEYDGIIYYALGGDYCNISKQEGLTEWPGNVNKKIVPISDIYSLDTNAHEIILYIPKDKKKVVTSRTGVYYCYYSELMSKDFMDHMFTTKAPAGYIGAYEFLTKKVDGVFALGEY